MIIRLLLLAILFLSSCTTLEQAKRVEPKGSLFNQELTLLYLEFADEEAKQYDWLDSQHFINKAMHAAYGHEVSPEVLADWRLPKDAVDEFTKARAELVELLANKHVVQEHYKIAAKALFNFDCWIEQQEENWQVDDIAKCRNGFYHELGELKKKADHEKKEHAAKAHHKKNNNVPAEKPKAKTEEVKQPNYKVRFAFDSAKVDNKAEKIIAGIAADVKAHNTEEIILNGYTDRVGTEDYNLKLSKNRAIAVRDELVKLGVDVKKIIIFAYGEANNEVHTMPGVAEPKNRRVEVIISD